MNSASELKDKIKKDLENNARHQAQESMENEVITKLVEANPVELPESLVKTQKKTLIENSKKRLSQYGMTPEEQEKWILAQDSVFEQEAQLSLKSSYLVDQLKQDLKIKATPEDIQKSLKESYPSKIPN